MFKATILQEDFSDRAISDRVIIFLRKINRAADINSKKLIKQIGLTGPQLLILQEVARRKEVTAGEIAKAISLSQATVTGILERMEKRELLTRTRNENDKRRIMIRLTKTGKKIIKNAPSLMHEGFVEGLNSLQDWEQTMILSALQRIVAIIEDKTSETLAADQLF